MKNYRYLFIGLTAFSAILLLNGCGEAEKAESPAPKAASVEVHFTTEDGVEIYADYYKGKGEEPPAVILLHMRGEDRKSWNPIIDKIVAKGYTVLALDMRGHGKSTKKGEETLNYKDFGTEGGPPWWECKSDVHAAREFLIGKGIDKGRIAIVSASIGCTIGIYHAAEDSGVKGLILLSPVIKIDESVVQAAASLKDRRVYIYCSKADDLGGSLDSAKEFEGHFKDGGAQATLHPAFEGSDHGTAMLGKKYGDIDVNEQIIKELDSILKD
jgi:pimeloyl-ACP methyl ester carboxylesterase